MKRHLLLKTTAGLTIMATPLMAFSSCSIKGKPEPDDPVVPLLSDYFELEQYWRLNYSCEGRREAPFKLLMRPDFDGGETIKVSISKQTTTIGSGTHTIKLIGDTFYNDKDIKDGDVEYQTFTLSFDDAITAKELEEIEFSLKFKIYKNNVQVGEQEINQLYLESARPTLPEYFSYKDTNQTILTGFDPDKAAEVEKCTMLIIPSTVKKIDGYAFYELSPGRKGGSKLPDAMKWILLDENWGQGECNLEEIGDHAFFDIVSCNSALYIPKTVKQIGTYAFQYCTFDTQVLFGQPSALEYIGEYSFKEFPNIEGQLVLPEHTSNELLLGQRSFTDWGKISSIKIPSRTKLSSGVFLGANQVKTLDFVDWAVPSEPSTEAFKNVGSAIPKGGKTVYISSSSNVDDWKNYLSASGLDIDSWIFAKK